MKRSIVTIGLFITLTIHGFGQGTGVFEFSNAGQPADDLIYIGEYMGPVKAEGDGYQIAIFWGPAGTTDENALVQAGTSSGFLTGADAGQFSAGERAITDP